MFWLWKSFEFKLTIEESEDLLETKGFEIIIFLFINDFLLALSFSRLVLLTDKLSCFLSCLGNNRLFLFLEDLFDS